MESYVIARRRDGELVGWTAPRGRNNQGEGAWTPFPEFFHYYATKQRAEVAIKRGQKAGNTAMDEAYVVSEPAFTEDAAALSEEDLIGAANGEPSGMYDDEEAYGDEAPSVMPSCPEPGRLVVRQVEACTSVAPTYSSTITTHGNTGNNRHTSS